MKKTISVLLIIIILCFFSITANSESLIVEEQNQPIQALSVNQKINPKLLNTYRVDSSENKTSHLIDVSLITANTEVLLKHFLNSSYAYESVFDYNSNLITKDLTKISFSENAYFEELCNRIDLGEAIRRYSKDILSSDNYFLKTIFNTFLLHPSVSSKIDINDFLSYASTTRLDYGGTIDIQHNITGTTTTASGITVYTSSPSRALTQDEINYLNLIGTEYHRNTRLANPSATYNCHSYAWHEYSFNNPYWIADISPYLTDTNCYSVVPITSVREKDIIVYTATDGSPLHSGVIEDVSAGGTLTIQSKWGISGVYSHLLYDVPSNYYANVQEGLINYVIYRYHDFDEYYYTGNHYHSGVSHFYEVREVCSICSCEGNLKYILKPCNGPPCTLPF